MQDFKGEFPVLKDYTYLNTPSSGLLSRSLTEWRHKHDLEFLKGGSIFREPHKTFLEGVRASVGRFFGASQDNVALVPNFSFGLNTLLEGLSKKHKILLLQDDYPSINWPVEFRGFEVCYAKIDENLEQNIEGAVTRHQPDVFAFSIVQYLSGIKIDFDFLRQLKAYRPDLLLIADGTQYLGTELFNFDESPLDVLGSSAYKWLLAGYGNGFFMVKDHAQQKLMPKTVGFNSAVFGKLEDIVFMKHFEPGHQDTLNYGSLEKSLEYMEAIGIKEIEQKTTSLSQKVKEQLAEFGLLNTSTLNREQHSTIFNLKGDTDLFRKLQQNKIVCSQRGKGIRVGFHFYNTEEDLERLMEVLKG